MDTRIKDRMTKAFTLLGGDLSPVTARSHLAAGTYGVILDSDDKPIALITDADIDQAATHNVPSLLHLDMVLPPTAIVGSEIDMNVLVNSGVMPLFNMETRGAIVTDDAGVAGVLPVAMVYEFLGGGEYRPTSRTMGDAGDQGSKLGGANLAGKFQTELAVLQCRVCGYPNSIPEVDDENLGLCQNPKPPAHTLKIYP